MVDSEEKKVEAEQEKPVVKIDVGCGEHKKEGFIGVDQYPMSGVDVIADLLNNWPWMDSSVDEINCSHFIEHFTAEQRAFIVNEMYRVLKPDGIVTMTVPYGFSERAFGDMTHHWPPVVGFWFYYLNRKWRLDEQNAPHTDIKYNPEGYSCDFEVTWGYNIHPAFHSKSRETQEFAVQWYKDAIMDIVATLKARKEKS